MNWATASSFSRPTCAARNCSSRSRGARSFLPVERSCRLLHFHPPLLSEHDRFMSSYDVIIIGAGPAGATSALLLARQSFRVIALEKSAFPRFHIGESILPRNFIPPTSTCSSRARCWTGGRNPSKRSR